MSGLGSLAKRLVRRNPTLNWIVTSLATLDREKVALLFTRRKYLSPFGGTWIDRKDFGRAFERKTKKREIKSETAELLKQWEKNGFVVLERAIAPEAVDRYLADLEGEKASSACRLFITASGFEGARPYDPAKIEKNASVRMVDDYFFLDSSRRILMNSRVMDFLETVFEKKPMLTQSLSFIYGSQQEIHQDTVFVPMSSPNKLAAIWVALQDVTPGSGELIYYPGSHLWDDYLFSGRFKAYAKERDGEEQLKAFQAWTRDQAKRHGSELKAFLPKKGDVFIWHAKLAHGGQKIQRDGATRLSLVGHYCPEGVRPNYQYFDLAKRKEIYRHGEFAYTTQYYSKPRA